MKKCAGCGVEKTKENTGCDSHLKDGFSSFCKICKNQRGRESYNRHKEEVNKRRLEKRHVDIEASRAYGKKWREKNRDKVREKNRLRRLKNPAKVRAEASKSQHKNREHRNAYKRKWRKENKDRIKNTMLFNQRISMVISASIRSCLCGNKNGRKWESLVGFTLAKLIKHLERNFKDGMTWDNHGRYGWHIDHIIPISAFNFETSDDLDFKRCWSLQNLQPMWSTENLIKGNSVETPFQPALPIACPERI